MAVNQQQTLVGYGFNHGLQKLAPLVIRALRDPGAQDFGQYTQQWLNQANPASPKLWIFLGGNVGSAIWYQVASGSGASFASLTVTPGPISLTGTTTINTSGAAATSIGVGGTGAVSIGNATGNTTIPAGNLIVTLGNISATAGSVSAGTTVTGGTGVVATTGTVSASAGKVIAGTTLQANGDAAGVAATTSITNATSTAAGAGTVTFAANGAGNITQTGWMKIYIGTTACYLPYFNAI